MSKYETLLSPIRIGSINLRSRTIQSGMVSNLSNEDGSVSPREIAYHVERAKNGVGLQLVGASYIEQRAKGYKYQIGIESDDRIPGFKALTTAVHEAGGNIGIQLWHGGSSADMRYNGGQQIVSASGRPTMSGLIPHELSIEEIKAIEALYADAAERAVKAGFDLVEVHGSHGYLIDQFFSPTTNFRTDEYGGSLENRMLFAREVVHEIRLRVGPNFPISFRITSDDLAGAVGTHIDDAIMLAKRLVENDGVQLINVSCGGIATIGGPDIPEAFLAENAAKIKAALGGKALVSVADRIKRPEVAEDVLASGKSDLITMGRALLCDPEFLTKAKEGREEDIRICASCCYCVATMMEGNRAGCMQNPLMGQEIDYDLSKSAVPKKKVVVIGGGPAGMQSAVICAKRGHDVTLLESSDVLGGKVNIADKPPFKFEMEHVINNLSREAQKLGVKIQLNTTATKESILAMAPDAVVVATGSVPAKPPIPGIDQSNVVTASDILLGKIQAGKNVVIIGGGTVGIETADYLLEKGHVVTVVEKMPAVMMDLPMLQQVPYMMRVFPTVSGILKNTKVLSINGSDVVTDSRTIKLVDTVVLAAGFNPVNVLAEELKDCGIEIVTVGDAVTPGKVFDATRSALKSTYNV